MWDLKYRPLKFSDVLGQDGSVQLLKRRLMNRTALSTSYIFSGAFGSGKCVSGDTFVPSTRGLCPISSLMGPNQIDPLSIGVVQEETNSTAAFSYRGGVRQTIRLRTKLGFELEGTPNHRIRVMASDGTIQWRQLGDISKGDYACIVRRGICGSGADISGYNYVHNLHDMSSKTFVPPSSLDENWGELMGYLVGDGSCKNTNSVSISCAESDVKERIACLLLQLGGSSSDTPDKRRPGLSNLRCSRKQFRSFLAYLGVGYVGAGDKVVPWAVMASPAPVVCAFLRAYFESDGSVGGGAIEAVTKSKELARQLQVLLANLGIITRRYEKNHPKYGIYWRILVRGTSVEAFAEQVGFVSARKKEALSDFLKKVHARGLKRKLSNVYDVVPSQLRHVERFYASLPKSLHTCELGRFFRARHGIASCTNVQVSRIARDFGHLPEAAHFVHLQRVNYVYDPVVSLDSGEAEVFDLNVPVGESFSANGFMNHNTTLARILARALLCDNLSEDQEPCNECDNCRAILDDSSGAFVEFDAASKGTIDNVRAIVDELPFSVFGAPKRVYLLDEIHRMSRDAQDVLLKPLEERKFVGLFCTTEPEKIRGAIRSRCEHYTIRKVTREDILARAKKILELESVAYEDDAILIVIDYSGGHVRDVLNRLEMIAQMGSVTVENTRAYLKLSVVATYYEVLLALDNPVKAISLMEGACEQVSAEDVASGLAEAAMNSYRMAVGMYADFAYVDKALGQKVHAKFGADTLRLAEFFLRSRYTTQVSLACDLLSWGQAIKQATPLPPIVVQQTVVGVVGSAPTNLTAPAPISVAPPAALREPPKTEPLAPIAIAGKNSIGDRFSEKVPNPGGHSDGKVRTDEIPRSRETNTKNSVTLTMEVKDDTKQLTPNEWRREFELRCRRLADTRSDPQNG
jgi:DNA polymerase III subunit gamma/tau